MKDKTDKIRSSRRCNLLPCMQINENIWFSPS